jgi:hypothetical protein
MSTIEVLDVTAISCLNCQGFDPLPLDLNAQFVVRPTFGTFYAVGGLGNITGTEDVILSMTGTLNGKPVHFKDNGSWLFPDGSAVGALGFRANGELYSVFTDSPYTLFGVDGQDVAAGWRAQVVQEATPEPGSVLLLGIGLALALAWKKLRTL